MQRVRTAGKLGYCFGVSQAIDKAVKFAEEHKVSQIIGSPLYSLGTIAHNENVVEYLRQRGVTTIAVEDLKPGMNVAITAHGAPPKTYTMLQEMGNEILDCTCPIVRKAQRVVSEQLDGFDILIFGDPDHQEVIGLNGWAGITKFVGNFNDLFTLSLAFKQLKLGKKVGIISQTTKIPSLFADFVGTVVYHHVDDFEELRVFNTTCPIVAARVNETRKLSEEVDIMFVVGSQESANTKNLADVARTVSLFVYIVQDTDQVGEALSRWYVENDVACPRVGVTAGTSTPIEVVKEVVTKLKELLYERESGF